jgi:hypothetical protein
MYTEKDLEKIKKEINDLVTQTKSYDNKVGDDFEQKMDRIYNEFKANTDAAVADYQRKEDELQLRIDIGSTLCFIGSIL